MYSPFLSMAQRDRERAEKREAVLAAAVALFNEKGFHATSLDDVAAALGVTKTVIYHHIGAKDQVLFHCVEIGLARLLAVAEESRQSAGNARERLAVFLRQYAEIIMTDFGLCIIRTGEELLTPEGRVRFRALKREIDEALRGLIAEGVAEGSLATGNVALAAATLAGAMNWTARWYRPDGAMRREEIAAFMIGQLLPGLLPR